MYKILFVHTWTMSARCSMLGELGRVATGVHMWWTVAQGHSSPATGVHMWWTVAQGHSSRQLQVYTCGEQWPKDTARQLQVYACGEQWPKDTARQFFTVVSLVLQYIVPCSIITFCYASVSKVLSRRAKTKIGNSSTSARWYSTSARWYPVRCNPWQFRRTYSSSENPTKFERFRSPLAFTVISRPQCSYSDIIRRALERMPIFLDIIVFTLLMGAKN